MCRGGGEGGGSHGEMAANSLERLGEVGFCAIGSIASVRSLCACVCVCMCVYVCVCVYTYIYIHMYIY